MRVNRSLLAVGLCCGRAFGCRRGHGRLARKDGRLDELPVANCPLPIDDWRFAGMSRASLSIN